MKERIFVSLSAFVCASEREDLGMSVYGHHVVIMWGNGIFIPVLPTKHTFGI